MRPKRTAVSIVHVVEPRLLIPYSVVGHCEDLGELAQARLNEGRQLVARSEEQLRRTGFQVQTAVEEGDSRSVILDFVSGSGVNLIVIGSHGRTGLDRFLSSLASDGTISWRRCVVSATDISKSLLSLSLAKFGLCMTSSNSRRAWFSCARVTA